MKTERKTATEDLIIEAEYDGFVTASTWAGSLTLSRQAIDGKVTSVLVEGGTLGQTYQITNTATLEDYSVVEKSVLIRIVSK